MKYKNPLNALVLLFSIIALPFSKEALSASACYQVFDFPSVSRIEATNETYLKVYFNNRHTDAKDDGIAYTYDKNQVWKIGEKVVLKHPQGRASLAGGENIPKACRSSAEQALKKIKPSKEEFVTLRPRYKHAISDPEFNLNQAITSCHNTSNYSLLGLGFYDGENSFGYGGVARFDRESGKLELVRNEFFAGDSINSIIEYNGQIFVGTTGFYECYGLPPTSGLLLYNWDKRKVSYVVNNEICGGVIHDMAVWNGDLWVATDMGLSKGTAPEDATHASTMWRYNWRNFVPSKNPGEGLREVACTDLYHELLLEMPLSNQHLETSIDFLLKSIEKNYGLKRFFIEFVEKHKKAIRGQE